LKEDIHPLRQLKTEGNQHYSDKLFKFMEFSQNNTKSLDIRIAELREHPEDTDKLYDFISAFLR
jgi:hypothetical protein